MKILVAEDDSVSRRLLEVTLSKWGYEVIACANGSAAWDVLQQPEAPQLVILDWMMPLMDGLEVCRHIRQRAAEPYIYVLLLTAKSQKSDMITGLEAGADDYLTKPFDMQELRMRLRAGQRIINLLDELIFAREALREQASKDSLTRLCNRATVLDTLERELLRVQRQHEDGKSTMLSIILADLDHFKYINDTYGHLAGDAVLRETARRMCEVVRPYDCLGRFGGEEFLLVLADCDHSGAETLAERLRQIICGEAIMLAEGPVSVTLSAGVATSSGEASDAYTLIGAADAALYRAKRNGRNRIEIATSEELTTGLAMYLQRHSSLAESSSPR